MADFQNLSFSIFIALFSSSINATTPPLPKVADTNKEIITLKDMEFQQSFNQSIKEVKVEQDRVSLTPEVPKSDKFEDLKVPYTQICTTHSLENEKFQSLRTVEFSAQVRVPSVISRKAEGGRVTTTIGSDQIILYSAVPDLRDPKSNFFRAKAVLDTAITGPIDRSDRRIQSEIMKNSVVLTKSTSRALGKVGEYISIVASFSAIAASEGYFTLDDGMAGIKSHTASSSTDSYIENSWERYKASYGSASNSSMHTYSVSEKSDEVKTRKLADDSENGRQVMVCWKTSNYSSVTSEAPQLIEPK